MSLNSDFKFPGLNLPGTDPVSRALNWLSQLVGKLLKANYDDLVSHEDRLDTHDTQIESNESELLSRITTFKQAGVPTAEHAGDIWFDTDDNNKPYVATAAGDDQIVAGEWVAVENPTDWPDVLDSGSTKPEDNATKNETTIQADEPAVGDAGDLWIDSDDGTPYVSDGSAWKRTTWSAVSADPNAPVNNATKNETTIQSAEPAVGDAGDMWIDSDDGAPYVSDGTAWKRITWAAIASDADAPANNATKNETTVQSAEPAVGDAGDIWIDSDDGAPYVSDGAAWKRVTWAAISGDASAPVDNATKNDTTVQSAEPAVGDAGDIWIDSDDGAPYISDGSAWKRVTWAAISGDTNAPEDGADVTGDHEADINVLNTTNAPADASATKNETTVQSSEPAVGDAGDIWIDSDDGTPYVSDGSAWKRTVWSAVSGDTDAPEDNATVGADWTSNLSNIPIETSAPADYSCTSTAGWETVVDITRTITSGSLVLILVSFRLERTAGGTAGSAGVKLVRDEGTTEEQLFEYESSITATYFTNDPEEHIQNWFGQDADVSGSKTYKLQVDSNHSNVVVRDIRMTLFEFFS